MKTLREMAILPPHLQVAPEEQSPRIAPPQAPIVKVNYSYDTIPVTAIYRYSEYDRRQSAITDKDIIDIIQHNIFEQIKEYIVIDKGDFVSSDPFDEYTQIMRGTLLIGKKH